MRFINGRTLHEEVQEFIKRKRRSRVITNLDITQSSDTLTVRADANDNFELVTRWNIVFHQVIEGSLVQVLKHGFATLALCLGIATDRRGSR